MTASEGHAGEKGFSLIELLVAMVITLIVSGAIYGLLAGGQNAFRREPELTERQQNIRMSMDLIMRDISNAGAGLPPWVQVFTPALNACVGCPDGGSAPGPTGEVRDELELMLSSGRDTEPACIPAGNAATPEDVVYLARRNINIPAGTLVALAFADGFWTIRRLATPSVLNAAAPGTNCTGNHTQLDLSPETTGPVFNVADELCSPSAGNAVLPPLGNAATTTDCTVVAVAFPRIVRYRIRDDAQSVPMLERFSTENIDGGFQAIARGIEDLQVQYTTLEDPTLWVDDAPITPPASALVPIGNWDDFTQQVRVTLASRSEARNIQGAVNNDLGADPRLRGSLTSTGTPRAVLMHVAQNHPASPYPPSPASWYWE